MRELIDLFELFSNACFEILLVTDLTPDLISNKYGHFLFQTCNKLGLRNFLM